MTSLSTLFPPSYEQSRSRFRQDLGLVQNLWPGARLVAHRLAGDEDLTIDWIEAQAQERKDKLLIFATGQHGIEGYVGSAMLQVFIEEVLPRLEPGNIGLLLIHPINPWGMKHWRHTNRAHVDLNRNFVWEAGSLDESFNPDYSRLESLLNPKGPIGSLIKSNLSFLVGLAWRLVSLGPQRVRAATLLGQYRFPQGLYFGGSAIQEETQVLMGLYRQHIEAYRHIILLDIHTGYGPRDQMSLVNSWMEPRTSKELAQRFSYPLVVKSNGAEFYSIQGDMIDYLYTLVHHVFLHKRFYATSLEFGTLGDSTLDIIRSVRTLVFENQMYWYGAKGRQARAHIEHDFRELFAPAEERWQAKAIADARQAFQGILSAEGFL